MSADAPEPEIEYLRTAAAAPCGSGFLRCGACAVARCEHRPIYKAALDADRLDGVGACGD